MKPEDIAKSFENRIDIRFKAGDLLLEALTHRSFLNERSEWRLPHNERLEFLGDAVLELIITEKLYAEFPNEDEGKLTVFRAALVNYQTLAKAGLAIGLQDAVLMSRGERMDNSRAREVILANAFEAVIGAVYLDQGMEVTRGFVDRFVWIYLAEILKTKSYKDAKSELQEIIQEKLRITPTYSVLGESGPAHERIFSIGVYFGEKLIAEGEGNSKQDAEIEAARKALTTISNIKN